MGMGWSRDLGLEGWGRVVVVIRDDIWLEEGGMMAGSVIGMNWQVEFI